MKAAVVSSFDSAPSYQDLPDPVAAHDSDLVVQVLAAGLHPRVRSQADGSHYTSTDELPLVPGIDGVGRGADGRLRYFILPDTTLGAMAEQTVIDLRRSIVLPEGSDPVMVAAAMNPAMSAWVALRQRVDFPPGQQVLVLGATGSAGQLAIQVSKLLGADQIIAAGRDGVRIAGSTALGATRTVRLGDDPETVTRHLRETCADVDVVLDYLWGRPTASTMAAVVTGRRDRSKPLTWVAIGSVAGPVAEIPSAALRASRLQIVGSGQGSVTTQEILAELSALGKQITTGSFVLRARPMPLADVERAWSEAAGTDERIVLIP